MMRKVELQPRNESFLSGYRLPELNFESTDLPYSSLMPIWSLIQNREIESARATIIDTMQERRIFPADERAALKIALAAWELKLGATDAAKRMAGRSLDLTDKQLSAHRILLQIHVAHKDYTAAYLHLANLPIPVQRVVWDEELSHQEIQIALASWAWQLGEWDQVSDHLMMAFPGGLSEMPADIREDWFKLALYRGNADDAAAAAESLLGVHSIDGADKILQTIVQSGWTEKALPLYRKFYTEKPESELLRRRLVALCVKEGNLEEARSLTMSGALKLAA